MYSQVLYRKYPTVSCDGKLHVDVALNPSDIINRDVMQNLWRIVKIFLVFVSLTLLDVQLVQCHAQVITPAHNVCKCDP